MKFSSDIGPQVLPSGFGPEIRPGKMLEDTYGPQINGGPNVSSVFKPGTIGPQVNPGPGDPHTKLGYHGPQINPGPGNVFTRPGQYGGVTRVSLPARRGFFPAATGVPGEPSVRAVDSYQGGPGGTVDPYRVRRSWTWGF